MPKYRISANLVWDCTGEDVKTVESMTLEALHKAIDQMSDDMETPIKKPKVSINRLKEIDKTSPRKTILAEYPVEEVFDKLKADGARQEFAVGDKVYRVKMNSKRYFVLKENRQCVACGIECRKAVLELPSDCEYPHFNLYGEDDGKWVLMTKDHKLAVARGGKDTMDNYQSMCAICNNIKGKDGLDPDHVKVLRCIYNEGVKKGKNSTEIHYDIQEHKSKLLTEINRKKREQRKAERKALKEKEEKEIEYAGLSKNDVEVIEESKKINWLLIGVYSGILAIDLVLTYFTEWYFGVMGFALAMLGFFAGTLR
jgi:uncharacterized secreted protein with C-terminal beta-propeller domain